MSSGKFFTLKSKSCLFPIKGYQGRDILENYGTFQRNGATIAITSSCVPQHIASKTQKQPKLIQNSKTREAGQACLRHDLSVNFAEGVLDYIRT